MTGKLEEMPKLVAKALDKEIYIKEEVAKEFKDASTELYLGTDLDYNLVMEGVLEIKEISYIHVEAFAAEESKHGTIDLIEA